MFVGTLDAAMGEEEEGSLERPLAGLGRGCGSANADRAIVTAAEVAVAKVAVVDVPVAKVAVAKVAVARVAVAKVDWAEVEDVALLVDVEGGLSTPWVAVVVPPPCVNIWEGGRASFDGC